METTRRGFLGILGGLLLGIVGERVTVAAPSPELWKAIPSLPYLPVRNLYLPLEQVCAQALDVMERELKWLRLKTIAADYQYRIGDCVRVREMSPVPFRPYDSDPCGIIQGSRSILLNHQSLGSLDLRAAQDMPFNEVSKRFIEPLALGMVENMIGGIRRSGGGEYLVSAKTEVPVGVHRGCVVTSKESGMSVRALNDKDPRTGDHILRIDTVFGVG